ncbi:carboxypeptidase-like regulatory domain-containing protein [Chryseobacterium caseinilyticum]|uniref:Carboxypeptidase-like regulatory domain-containing protein n=1 Tax=Chryseobacterium caseinilyticum TaxID=2771428 RepID=A0ABR8ZGZ7_9FLAO|nr:carboxypeptidase-like regulatory domain-containing protein [Chryseobacterium caseinilyticum]MBD8084073.1 carboxypeptidase-like regulatory domain-containing protein [Chryseobacterium caseinilyticum]
MKKTLLLLLIILPFYISFAQTVKGTVVNDLDKPIPQVSIYLDGTTTATTSAADGSFSLNIPNSKNGVLVFQKENFDTYTVNVSEVLNKTLKVGLLKARNIEEVKIIPYTEATYKRYIGHFLNAFIGMDHENVKIKNQRTLKFAYDSENKILRVKAPQTLIIENKNLGYTIQYNLVEFVSEFDHQTTRFYGTSFFTVTNNNAKMKLNRMNAFDGSQVHFFRSVFAKKVESDGFIVNQITKFPNEKYPTPAELQKLNDYTTSLKSKQAILSIPSDISDIAGRKRTEPAYKIAITKMRIPETDYTKNTDGKLILDYDYMMQINFKKYFYEYKKGQFVKTKNPIVQTSYLHPDGETFEISSDGNTSNPGMLTNQGEFANNKIENLLPLDYELGD